MVEHAVNGLYVAGAWKPRTTSRLVVMANGYSIAVLIGEKGSLTRIIVKGGKPRRTHVQL